MRQVTFGNLKSYDDLHFIIGSKDIGTPSVKTSKIDIEGADGVIDQTEFFGQVNYGNRTNKYECSLMVYPLHDYFSALADFLHGQKMKIVHGDDPDWYYIGRLSLSDLKEEKGIGEFTITADCEPYKLKHDLTVVTQDVSASAEITLTNSRKRAVPTITSTAEMTFSFGDYTITHSAGTFILPEVELTEGENVVTVTGTGTVTFEWQEGRL